MMTTVVATPGVEEAVEVDTMMLIASIMEMMMLLRTATMTQMVVTMVMVA